jgi:oligopeptide transport system ATP-binding protein
LRDIRGGQIGLIFQDPMTSLNPVLTVERQIVELIRRHTKLDAKAAGRGRWNCSTSCAFLMPQRRIGQYPHQFSGGMRQRAMIAIGVACEPKLLIADEATTALDVTVQAQILDLIKDLKRELGMAMIWITHDMGVVAGIADNCRSCMAAASWSAARRDAIFADTRSAYTWGLLQSLPDHSESAALREAAAPDSGLAARHDKPPEGDPFAPRNAFATRALPAGDAAAAPGRGQRAGPSRRRLVRSAKPR